MPVSLCLYVYSYGPLSVCLYMSLSVLVFILIYVLSYIFSAYSPDYGLQVNRPLYFLLLDPSGNLVYIMAVLLSVFVYAYY